MAHDYQFEVAARKLCRERGLPELATNVETIVRAMKYGARAAETVAIAMVVKAQTQLRERREKANAPQ